jgi:hypothetical protein
MPDEIRRIGAQMANVMYQLAQRPGDALTPEVAAVMDSLRRQWDAAVRAASAAPPVELRGRHVHAVIVDEIEGGGQ